MPNTIHKSTQCTSRDQRTGSRRYAGRAAEVKERERATEDDYLPMDVFVDPKTMREHFQRSSIRARCARPHPRTRRPN